MTEHYPKIRLQAGYGMLMAREGLSLIFYMRKTHKEVVEPVSHALEAYLRAVGPQALGWYIDMEGEPQQLDATGWELTWRKLRERSSAIIRLHDASPSEYSYRFEYHGKSRDLPSFMKSEDATCAVSFWLPTEFLEQHSPSRVRELALEWAAPLPFYSGHGGLSLNGDLDVVGVAEEIAPYCLRYPGMDIAEVHHLSWTLGTRLRGPHWLTFLGQPVLGELGGPAALRSRLHSPGTTVQEMDGDRVLITLGEWPEAGDLEQGDTLPAYRELARVLEPWLFHEPRGLMLPFSREQTRRWERRFLD